jgi:voltage-gated potassium channel
MISFEMIDNNPLARRLFGCCAVIAGVLMVGTIGYMFIEHWSTRDSFYMSVITLSTVGYGETRELSPAGRLFTTALIFISVAGLSCWTASLTALFVEGDLSGSFRKKRAKKMAASLTDHTIVCGSGMMARTIVDELTKKDLPVVIVDDDQDGLQVIRNMYPGVPIIEASAVDDMSMFDANILESKSVVAALPSDFDNLLISMTCKDLGMEIQVIARSNDPRIAGRMVKAGVDNVICPFQLSGVHAVTLLAG